MLTPFIKSDIILSHSDHPNTASVLLFTDLYTCNLNCLMCLNKETARKIYKLKRDEVYLLDELIPILKDCTLFGVELLIICGGEPTLVNKKIMDKTLIKLKENLPELKLRIDTNGQLPDRIKELKELVDGFAVDLKIPLKTDFSEDEQRRYSLILGVSNLQNYVNNLLETINIVKDMKYTIFRTVKYPLLSEEELKYNSENYGLNIIFLDFVDTNKLCGAVV